MKIASKYIESIMFLLKQIPDANIGRISVSNSPEQCYQILSQQFEVNCG